MACVHTSIGALGLSSSPEEEDKDERKFKERNGEKGEAETAEFVRRYPAPVVERGLMATW
jgi:hypothetical protein